MNFFISPLFVSGFFDFICNVASSICSGISNAVSSIGSALSTFAASIAPVIGLVLDKISPYIKIICNIANTLLQIFGILKPEENVEEVGDRALQAAEQDITMDKFDDFDEYMAALRNFELDPEKSKKYSEVEKIVAGIGVGTIGMEDKLNVEQGSLSGIWLLPLTNSDYFTPERMKSLLELGRLGGDMLSYLEKRMDFTATHVFETGLEVNIDGSPMNDAQLNKLYDGLDKAREEWGSIQEKIKE